MLRIGTKYRLIPEEYFSNTYLDPDNNGGENFSLPPFNRHRVRIEVSLQWFYWRQTQLTPQNRTPLKTSHPTLFALS
jgi:aminoglycoside/choline kinase family phosphotransferase